MLGATQPICYILRLLETKCNGLTSLEGHLQGFDLKLFCQFSATVLAKVHPSSVFRILWEFFTCRGDRKTLHGYVLATEYPQRPSLLKVPASPLGSRVELQTDISTPDRKMGVAQKVGSHRRLASDFERALAVIKGVTHPGEYICPFCGALQASIIFPFNCGRFAMELR